MHDSLAHVGGRKVRAGRAGGSHIFHHCLILLLQVRRCAGDECGNILEFFGRRRDLPMVSAIGPGWIRGPGRRWGGPDVARVLVVDDDPDLRALVEVRLKRLGHLVLAVGSGAEALEVLAVRGAPEIAVLDVLLPGMTGFDLLARLRQIPACAELPIIFLSGRVEAADIEAGRALGATYLTKPLVISALANALDQALLATPRADASW